MFGVWGFSLVAVGIVLPLGIDEEGGLAEGKVEKWLLRKMHACVLGKYAGKKAAVRAAWK